MMAKTLGNFRHGVCHAANRTSRPEGADLTRVLWGLALEIGGINDEHYQEESPAITDAEYD